MGDDVTTAEDFQPGGDDYEALAKLKPHLASDAKIVFKGCNTFTGEAGHQLAQNAASFFNCTVGGHNALIGYWLRYPGYHELKPGEKPSWPLEEEDAKEYKPKPKDKPPKPK